MSTISKKAASKSECGDYHRITRPKHLANVAWDKS